jgi:hypothetical protein
MANIVKVDKFLGITKKTNVAKFSAISKKGTGDNQNLLLNIEKKVIKIDKLLKDSLVLQKTQNEKKRVATEQKTFADEEKELEKKKPKESQLKGGISLPSPPKLGIFGWIKNFISNLFLGFIAVRLIDHLPQLIKTLPIIMKAGEAIIDFAGSLLNGLVTFVDWGYKAVDATRGFIKTIGGDNAVKLFDNFGGAINKLIDVAIIAAMVAGDMGGDSGGGGGGGGRGLRVGGKGAGRVDPRVARRYAERFGRDAALKKFGKEGVENLGGKYARSAVSNVARKAFVGLVGKGGAKTVLKFIKPFTKRLPIIGGLIDFGLSVALGESPGRAAFKAIGATLLGAIGGMIGAVGGPAAIAGAIIGGMAGDWAGGALYDLFFGGKKPAPTKTTKAATGGPITSGGKSNVGSGKRTITKKTKRTIKLQPTKIKPGASIGGEEKIKKIFPEPDKKDAINPLGYMKKSYNTLSSSPGFGGVFGLALKANLGEKPSDLDYKIAASGLSSWMESNLGAGGAFAEGGSVDVGMFGNGKDMTNMIAKSLEESISSKVDNAINDLMKQLGLKGIEKEKTSTSGQNPSGVAGEEDFSGSSGGEKAMHYLISQGLTGAQAAGIAGNLQQESGFGPDADNGTHHGIAQWDKQNRWPRVSAYISSVGKDPNTLEGQLVGLKWEAERRGDWREIKQATSARDASAIWLDRFERSGEKPGMRGFENRMTYANSLLAKYGNYVPQSNDTGEDAVGETSATLSGKFGLLSLGGSSAPGGDRTLNASSTFSSTHLHNNESDSSGHNSDLAAQGFGPPRDYVITRGDQSKDRGSPIPAGISGIAKRVGGSVNIVDIVGQNGEKLARFMHNDTIKVSDGQKVSPNTIIATQGSAGTGMVHVHLQASPQNQTRWIKGITKSYFRGGLITKPSKILIAEKGAEFVLDNDTTRNSPPGFLDALNKANTKQGVMYIIQKYASYNQPYGREPQIVEVPVYVPMPGGGGGGGGMIIGGGVNNNDQFACLAIG